MTHPLILSDDEKMFRDEIRKFAEATITPHIEHMDETESMNPEIISQCFEMGLMGIEVPEEFGGAESSFTTAIIAVEEISRVDPSVGVFVDVQNTLMNNILKNWGSKEQQAKYFPMLATEKVGGFGLTEPDSGSDAFALRSKAVKDGDDYLITGKKVFITNAKEAEVFIVFANVKPEEGYKGITAFIVEKDTPGFSIGKKEKKLGIRASSTCELILENVRVPATNIVGELQKGYKIAIEALNEGRIGIAAQMLGLARGAYEGAYKYAYEREQFGKPLAKFQSISFKLAELATDIETCRLHVYNASRRKDAGLDFRKEAAMAKLVCSELAEKVAAQALEIYGGYGFIKEFPAEKYYRDVKIGKLYEGTSNMQLNTIFKLLEAESK